MDTLVCNDFSKHCFHNGLGVAVGMYRLDKHQELFLEGVRWLPVCGHWLRKDVALCLSWDGLVFRGVGAFVIAVSTVDVVVVFAIVFIFFLFFVVIWVLVGQRIGLGAAGSLGELVLRA